MLTRRRFLGTALAAGAAAAVPGCSSVLPEPDVRAAGFGENATGTVQVWCRAATQSGLTALVEKFNASQDRLTVELTPVLDAQYVTKLATAIRGREVPDLVDIDDINSMLFIYRDAFCSGSTCQDSPPEPSRGDDRRAGYDGDGCRPVAIASA